MYPKNLHKATLELKEFLNFRLEVQRKYKKLRKESRGAIIYFSKTINKFYGGTLTKTR